MGYGSPQGYGEGGYGDGSGGTEFLLSKVQGCTPLLKDPFGAFWALSVDDIGELTLTSLTITPTKQLGPYLLSSDSSSVAWQLGVDAGGFLTTTSAVPPFPPFAFPYIPLNSPGGFAYKLTIDSMGTLSVTSTVDAQGNQFLLPDVIPYPFDVTMSIYGDPNLVLFCSTCGNASVTASADLSLWCCSCNSFVLPEDTNIARFLDE